MRFPPNTSSQPTARASSVKVNPRRSFDMMWFGNSSRRLPSSQTPFSVLMVDFALKSSPTTCWRRMTNDVGSKSLTNPARRTRILMATAETQIAARRLDQSEFHTLMGIQVLGTGAAVPDEIVRNEDLAALGCDADWICSERAFTNVVARRPEWPPANWPWRRP